MRIEFHESSGLRNQKVIHQLVLKGRGNVKRLLVEKDEKDEKDEI